MDENLHNIENLFYSALEGHEEAPSKNVWEAVDKRLDKDNLVNVKKKNTFLKGFAVLLLLLLGIALFIIHTNRTGNNGLAKNNPADSGNLVEYNKTSAKTSNKKDNNNSTNGIDAINSVDDKDENGVPGHSVGASKEPIHHQEAEPGNQLHLQKQNIAGQASSAKDISKNQPPFTSYQKKKITTKPTYKLKVTNAELTAYEEPLVQNNSGAAENQTPILQEQKQDLAIQKNVSIEIVQPATVGSGNLKKSPEPIVPVNPLVSLPGDGAVAKSALKKQRKPSKFSVMPFFSPDNAWHNIHDDKNSNQTNNASVIGILEKREFAYTAGALVDYKLNKHWGLQSGITLSIADISVKPEEIYAEPDNTGKIKYRVNTSSGYGYILPSFSPNPAIGDSLIALSTENILNYVGIPLAATYTVAKGKFRYHAIAGFSTNILTKAKVEIEVEKGNDKEKEVLKKLYGIKNLYFSGLAGIGVDYQLTKKTAISFSPTMRFALNAINRDASVKTYPMSFGYVVGFKIGL